MKSRFPRHAVSGSLLALLMAACGGGSEVLIVPLFEFTFQGTSGTSSISMSFQPIAPTTATGTFTSVNVDIDLASYHYGGTWSSCTFSISTSDVITAPAAASYAGRFKTNDIIELTPTDGSGQPTLTLTRNPSATQQSGC